MGYLLLCLRRAFAGSVFFTDKLSIMAAVLVPSILLVSGRSMTDAIESYIAVAVIVVVGCGVTLRLLAAPYLIWRDDQVTIGNLRAEIGDPDEIARRALEEDKINDRKKVVAFLAAHRVKEMISDMSRNYVSEFAELTDHLNRLILDDKAILPLADDFMRTHSELLQWLRIYARTNKITDSDLEVMQDRPPVTDAYIAARDALYRRVALKDIKRLTNA